jgi:hypothetical protein
VAWATYAADAACTTPVAYQVTPSRGCPKADVVVAYQTQGCATSASYFAPGETRSIDDVFLKTSDAACVKLRTQPDLYSQVELDHVFYEVGAPVAPDTYPALLTEPVGRGRLVVPMLAGEDGTPLAPSRPDTFQDTLGGGTCRMLLFDDGTRRCVPVEAVPITARSFADAQCQKEIVGVARDATCTGATLPGYAVRLSATACSPDITASAVLKLGGEVALDVFYVGDDAGGCSSQPAAGTFLEVSGPIDSATLGRITEVVE